MNIASNTTGGADTPKSSIEVNDENHNKSDDKGNEIVEQKKTEKKTQEWRKPRRTPTEEEQRRMFGKALEMMLTLCLDNHCYQFNGLVRVQKKGGPIGLRLTGEIADCIMIDWDKTLLAELRNLGINPDIYTRFKDDITIFCESLEKGSKICEDRIIVDDVKNKEDQNKSQEKVTMEVIQSVANDIDEMIQLTIETPFNFVDKKIPILDVKVKVNEEEGNRIDFEFFENQPRCKKSFWQTQP